MDTKKHAEDLAKIVDSLRESQGALALHLKEILEAIQRVDIRLISHEESINTYFDVDKPERVFLKFPGTNHFRITWAGRKFYFAWFGMNDGTFPTENDIAYLYEGVIPPRTDLVLNKGYLFLELDPLWDKLAYFVAIYKSDSTPRNGPIEVYRFNPREEANPNAMIQMVQKILSQGYIYIGDRFIPRNVEEYKGY